MSDREEKPLDPVARLDLSNVAARLDEAFEQFRRDYPNIPEEEARAIWREAGG
jgi:hypothetical protein